MSAPSGSGHYRVLAALVVGAALGVAANSLVGGNPAWKPHLDDLVHYVTRPVGQIFINLLMMAIIPLVFASISLGVGKLGEAATSAGSA